MARARNALLLLTVSVSILGSVLLLNTRFSQYGYGLLTPATASTVQSIATAGEFSWETVRQIVSFTLRTGFYSSSYY